ncbi:nicotinate-nucleotide--dimethylbenzimidazole phosphoribosyltransferase [Methylobacillus gramineus]|uniref:nicotinate-nucleotide--dimethylbenzimidazole phosphoribosyltransferase n=1 Tax=Methylobacillus gramineus TaxID=755169 RepID=UPI001CFF61EB|nr:nicotinate-nucleotide--dimethylbenzimidazole phosphoribosyltransferase [Methylobacillus gramineus]MCB5185466.1 nicotinate-nucleotide--dimethylbenzimidazole phosphoribosyltransferase [Methylobacillus gramineus]
MMATSPVFSVEPLNKSLQAELKASIDNKTKPLGALGVLETLALQVGLIQNTLTPALQRPVMLVFAGDHGVVEAGVSPYPQVVTQQMVLNFLAGGAGINVFARQQNMRIRVVDAGVNHEFPAHPDLIRAKVGMGTNNFLDTPAMTTEQCAQALCGGRALAHAEIASGSNVMGFGEMGIGNTTSASALVAVLCKLPVESCVGRGTGLDDAGVAKKAAVISTAIDRHQVSADQPLQVLATYGGFEIAMMVGAMLGAAERKAILLIDGFIATAALLVASRIAPEVLEYCVFAHCSDESGHDLLLQQLNAKPLLNLGLRLGEGTGAALAYPLLQAAVNFLNQMASFSSANISRQDNA